VFQTDFSLKDGAVAAMKGVAHGVSPRLALHDLTHEIPPFNIWDAACRLKQTVAYWPPGTVFVSVVDPGVGTERRSVVARTRAGHYVVTPDNGTLTFLAESPGLAEVRVIDAGRQRLPGSAESHTFHGRDVFAYVAARLAAGRLRFRDVGPAATNDIVRLPYQRPALGADGVLRGTVTVSDPNYGNVWSNIPKDLLARAGLRLGDTVAVRVTHDGREVFAAPVKHVTTFGEVPVGAPLLYLNSLLEAALAVNQGSFAAQFKAGSGPGWEIEIGPAPR
jgi:hypothetical protein